MDEVDCEQITLDQDAKRGSLQSNTTRTCPRFSRLVLLVSLVLLVQYTWSANLLRNRFRGWRNGTVRVTENLCPQVEALGPSQHETLLRSLDEEFASSKFRLRAYESLGGAIRIPTESYDDLGLPSEDPRLKIMGEFHNYLESRFPKVHASLRRTRVNTYALVYEWKGTKNVKPLLLAAHMDVVPVNPDTCDDWIQPPYSGYYDGELIWGRGSSDDKASLIASLIVIEALLEHGFIPSRTVLLAFGFDEESGGRRGAHVIAQYLLETYGPDSLAMIVDEGNGYSTFNGVIFATPAVTERGSMNIRMDVLTPGGHSSMPPNHTGIGILADLITELEAHPPQPTLIRESPYYQTLECRTKYDTGFPDSLRVLFLDSQTSDEKLQELGDHLIDYDPLYYVLSGTTQAIDVIGGGVKVNALPETAWAVINNRIASHSSLAEVMARFTDIALPVATRHNMTLEAFGETVGSQVLSQGTIHLYDVQDNGFEPSPTTPSAGSGPFALLSGTIRSTIQSQIGGDDILDPVIVSPGITRGNTDTRHYWNLTRHIFRYHHRDNDDIYPRIHTTNEAIRAHVFIEQIRFFTRLVLNADRSDLLE